MHIEPAQIAVGDKGYYGDRDGAYVVEFVSSVGLDLRHETGEWDPIRKMSWAETEDQNWAWYRD
jgi:hypothetical protein